MNRKIIRLSISLALLVAIIGSSMITLGFKNSNIKIGQTEATPVVFPYDKPPAVESTHPSTPPDQIIEPWMKMSWVEPVKLFDNFYWVGSTQVGCFIIDSGAGLIMIDSGFGVPLWEGGKKDIELIVDDIKKLGLNPASIKLIINTHEHIDHYGGDEYLKTYICPKAKVAMSLIGWNYLITRPAMRGYYEPRPRSIDIFLEDGQLITLGDTKIQIVYTPGHSFGCMSLIIPVKDNGTPHVVGIMGGSKVNDNWDEAMLYYQSVDYFQGFTRQAGCDVGLGVHASSYFKDFDKLRVRKPGDPNPLVIGTSQFETVYLAKYRTSVLNKMKSLPEEPSPVSPPK